MTKNVLDGLVSNIPPQVEPEKAAPPVRVVSRAKTVRIILEDNPNIPPTGQFFGLNGKSYLIRSGVEVDVPIGIIDILNNAVEEKAQIDQTSLRMIGSRKTMRYPYRRIPTAREIEARREDENEAAA